MPVRINYFACFVVILLFSILIFKKKNRILKNIRYFIYEYKDIVFLSIINVILIILIMPYIWNKYKTIFWEIRWIFMGFIFFGFFLLFSLFILLLRKKQNNNLLRVYLQYSEYLEVIMQELKRQRHEYKNQLNVIVGLIDMGGGNFQKELSDYIQGILNEHKEEGLSKELLTSGNNVISAMLYQKQKDAESLGIEFIKFIKKPLPSTIPICDLLEVLSNLLNNAFEEVLKLQDGRKKVFLRICANEIEVINTVAEDFQAESIFNFCKIGYSTKGADRGYGVANIKHIIDRYNGKLRIYVKEDMLVFLITF